MNRKKINFFRKLGLLDINDNQIKEYLLNKQIVEAYKEQYKQKAITNKSWVFSGVSKGLATVAFLKFEKNKTYKKKKISYEATREESSLTSNDFIFAV